MKKVLSWADIAFFLAFLAFIMFRARWGMRTWIGVAVTATGFVLWIIARLQLGDAFSLKAKAEILVTTGLYSKFRHPIYLFGFVAYCGVMLIWGRWIPFLCLLLIYSVEVARVRKEERILAQTFGQEYCRYRENTWF